MRIRNISNTTLYIGSYKVIPQGEIDLWDGYNANGLIDSLVNLGYVLITEQAKKVMPKDTVGQFYIDIENEDFDYSELCQGEMYSDCTISATEEQIKKAIKNGKDIYARVSFTDKVIILPRVIAGDAEDDDTYLLFNSAMSTDGLTNVFLTAEITFEDGDVECSFGSFLALEVPEQIAPVFYVDFVYENSEYSLDGVTFADIQAAYTKNQYIVPRITMDSGKAMGRCTYVTNTEVRFCFESASTSGSTVTLTRIVGNLASDGTLTVENQVFTGTTG